VLVSPPFSPYDPDLIGLWERLALFSGNDPNGSRPEPGAHRTAPTLCSPPGEAPQGRARGVQDTATRVQSESER
jgi:hypothetical protein